MKQGLLIILSGPIGVGKGTLKKELIKQNLLNVVLPIQTTSKIRKLREKNGKDYNFISQSQFKAMIDNNQLLEYTIIDNNYYGFDKQFIERHLLNGDNVLIDTEPERAISIMEKYRGMYTLSIFVTPPSIEELEKRMRRHQKESEEEIQEKLAQASKDIEKKDLFDSCLTNYTIAKTLKRLLQAINNRINYINTVESGEKPNENYILKRP